jgi:hypothetical protein
MQFHRRHHQLIAGVLANLDANTLKQCNCFFAGGTALALLHGEYRESNDMDFLVSDVPGYRTLRTLLTGTKGFEALARPPVVFRQIGEVRADQYGIRGKVETQGVSIRVEIVLEARIALDPPQSGDRLQGVCTLSALDLLAEKMLANSDRWADAAIFSRDIIDLAMMGADKALVKTAMEKAKTAYGAAIKNDLEKSLDRALNQVGWMERCIEAMAISVPKAELFQRLAKFGRDAGLAVRPKIDG